jgi:hypothetical protein
MGRRSERRARLAADRPFASFEEFCKPFLLKFCDSHGISLKPCWQIRTEAKAHLPAASRLASAAKPTVPHFATKRKTSVLLEYHC